jgi:AcrR family transcriptional regulator
MANPEDLMAEATRNTPPKPENGWDLRRRRIGAHVERVALTLFAERGYRSVTVADIAAAAGISARTVARYFPMKEDFILAIPRRGGMEALQQIRALAPSADPVSAVWDVWINLARIHEHEMSMMLLWDGAVKTAPELRALAVGELTVQLRAALIDYCGKTLGVDPRLDVRASVLAAVLSAANDAVVSFWLTGSGKDDIRELFLAAREVLPRVPLTAS